MSTATFVAAPSSQETPRAQRSGAMTGADALGSPVIGDPPATTGTLRGDRVTGTHRGVRDRSHQDDGDLHTSSEESEDGESPLTYPEERTFSSRFGKERLAELDLEKPSRRTRSTRVRGDRLDDHILSEYPDERRLRGGKQTPVGRRNKSVDPKLFSDREHSRRVDSDDEASDPAQAALRSASVLSPEQMAVVGQAINLLTSDELKQFVECCSKVRSKKIRAGKAKALPDEFTDQGDDFFMSAAEDVENDGDIESDEGDQPPKGSDQSPVQQEKSPEQQAPSKEPTPSSVDPAPVVGKVSKSKSKTKKSIPQPVDPERERTAEAEAVQRETVRTFITGSFDKEKGKPKSKKDKPTPERRQTRDVRGDDLLGKMMSGLPGGQPIPSDSSSSSSDSSDEDSAASPPGNRDPNSDKSGPPPPPSPSGDPSDNGGGSDGNKDKKKKKKSKKNKSRHGSSKAQSSSSSSEDERIKPIEPTVYNGNENLHDFRYFMYQTQDYLETGRVKLERQVTVAGRFLGGVAREYFMSEVAHEAKKWTLYDFFCGLFYHVFKQNFRTVIRDEIEAFEQGSMTIRQYATKLCSKFAMLPDETERYRIIRLWKGLRPQTRRELVKKGLNQEYSDWKDILGSAERIEDAEREYQAYRAKEKAEDKARKRATAEEDRRNYQHHQRAVNRVNNDGIEHNKYNRISRRNRDYSAKPVPESNEDYGRRWFGKKSRGSSKRHQVLQDSKKPEQRLSGSATSMKDFASSVVVVTTLRRIVQRDIT
jgi:hypothetical protein